MNKPLPALTLPSACPHDCPSTCALDIEILPDGRVGRVHGAEMDYTAGVICAKVARYAERLYHPDRLLKPMMRTGPKGSRQFKEISWDEALDRSAEAFLKAEAAQGAEAVWPYFYAGTMGLVQRDGIERLRHVKKYSREFDTICVNPAWTGFIAGTGRLAGPDPREMALADCVVIWGTNAVATQVNVMTHAIRARKTRGAKIVVVDIYENDTVRQADLGLVLRPGTDAALACAVMHVAFRDGYADRDYLARFADDAGGLEAHLATRTPDWAAAITGLTVGQIEDFAALVGRTKRSYFRLGYGFTRTRNGAVSMHAAASIATVLGSWAHEGGGAFHNNGAIYRLDKSMIMGTDVLDPTVRQLDQSRIGRILTGDRQALMGGPPVTAMLIQNTNPMNVAPEQALVRQGFAREDLFTVVHEQFLTDTAAMADIVIPATMFLEHDDIYKGGGHQYLIFGPKAVEPPDGPRENHWVIGELARRLGAEHPGFGMTVREHIDWMLTRSGYGTLADLERDRWRDCQPDFDTAHYTKGFATPDGRFRFRPDWTKVEFTNMGPMGPWADMPAFPDWWPVTENADAEHPFRLATSPARGFLNSTFAETTGSRAREGRPSVMIHPDDAGALGIAEGDRVTLGNARGQVVLAARLGGGAQRGVLIAEGLWANRDHEGGAGINTLTGADPVAPFGGAALHDTRVWLRRA
jgi:anaerobic selenocysteine-containing dehydrogenase